MFALLIIACVTTRTPSKIVESNAATDSQQTDTAMTESSPPETETTATAPVVGTHRFIAGCTDDLDEVVLCGMMLDFRFLQKIDLDPEDAEAIPLQYDLWWESSVGAPGFYIMEAEVRDSDANLEYFRPLWSAFGYMERAGECDQDDTTTNSVAWIPNKAINSWSESQNFTFTQFLAGGTTTCVAHTDDVSVSLSCTQFSTQTCDDTWEAALGIGCDFLTRQPVDRLAEGHPYFYGSSSSG